MGYKAPFFYDVHFDQLRISSQLWDIKYKSVRSAEFGEVLSYQINIKLYNKLNLIIS